MSNINVNSEAVMEMIAEGNVQIIDVRESYEYEMGHVEGAQLIPLNTIPNNMEKIDKDKKIVLICASGGRSTSASSYLSQFGYDTYNVVGGMFGWNYAVVR